MGKIGRDIGGLQRGASRTNIWKMRYMPTLCWFLALTARNVKAHVSQVEAMMMTQQKP